jgi:hypothetical protein
MRGVGPIELTDLPVLGLCFARVASRRGQASDPEGPPVVKCEAKSDVRKVWLTEGTKTRESFRNETLCSSRVQHRQPGRQVGTDQCRTIVALRVFQRRLERRCSGLTEGRRATIEGRYFVSNASTSLGLRRSNGIDRRTSALK